MIHLLFSTNRWEKREELTKALDAGQHVLIDRYAYSGVAFSAAKAGMDLDWCRGPDRGLPKPGKGISYSPQKIPLKKFPSKNSSQKNSPKNFSQKILPEKILTKCPHKKFPTISQKNPKNSLKES